jgi:hypothetical protein
MCRAPVAGDAARMRRLSMPVMLTAMAAVALAIGPWCDGGRSDYLAANNAVLRELPPYPGATEVMREIETVRQRTCAGAGALRPFDHVTCPTAGWATHLRYEVPATTTSAMVRDHYQSSLPSGWMIEEMEEIQMREPTPRGEPEKPVIRTGDYRIQLRRGDAAVGISTCVSASCNSGQILVRVDHRYYAH